MKRMIFFISMLLLWVLLLGMQCEKRKVQVPVLVTVETPLQINSDNVNFASQGEADLTEFIEDVRQQENFDEILGIYLESVSFVVSDNASKPGTVAFGTIKVRFGSSGSYKPFIQIDQLDLDAIQGIVQKPELDGQGVIEVSKALSPIVGGERKIYFLTSGSVTKTPPPNLRFKLTLKVAVTVVGVVETEVPVI